ncbi:hypothetical protein EYR36_010235 [Pleurotus pulmonarius]|nr:hypothetical protein EYR36_010235 [Pleurotus pulmonarius]
MDAKTTLHITLQERVEVLEKDSDLPEPPSHPVDGGARAWCTLFGGTLIAMVTFGYVNAFGVYQDIYTRSQAATASNVSWIGSTQLFFLFAMGLPAGKLLDMGYLRQTNLSSVGFEWGVRASAFVVLGLLVAANLLISDNPSVKSDGEKPVLKNILTDIPFMLTSFGVFVITWGIFFPYFYIQLFAVVHGVDPKIAFYSLAIMNAAGLPGRIFPGILADRFGPFNIIVPVLLVNSALIFSLFGVSNEGAIVAFVVLYGAFSGAFVTLWAPCAAALAVHPNEVGIRFGVGYFMSAFGALIGTPINGALLGETFLWSKPIIFSGIQMGT